MATVGEALVTGLAARGVKVVFGIPGVHTIELYRGLAGSGIRHVTARHEAGAGFMADGYARVSGHPGVALVISGPGVTNILTPMAQARADSVPMLVISGVTRRDSQGRGLGLLHELPDQHALVGSLCRSFRLEQAHETDSILDRAFAVLSGTRPGPVHLEVPTDVMGLDHPAAAWSVADGAPAAAIPDPVLLDVAAGRLGAAKRPLILAGGGCARACGQLRALAERLDAPVVQTVNARGVLYGHPLGVPASPSLAAVRSLIAQSDAVLAVGTELGPTDYDMYGLGGLPDLSGMIRIDICPLQLARHPASLVIEATAQAALAGLVARLSSRENEEGSGGPDGTHGAQRAEVARSAALAGLDDAMQAQIRFLAALRDARPSGIIVGDSTQPVYAGNLLHDHDRAGGWFNAATGYGALGYAPGAAIGAALAAPGVPVTCLIGDGGLMFSAGEVMTAVDEALPIVFLVWNNRGFREIAEAMKAADTPVLGCDPTPPDMHDFAAACGIPHIRITADPDALRTALADRLGGRARNGPCLVEISVP